MKQDPESINFTTRVKEQFLKARMNLPLDTHENNGKQAQPNSQKDKAAAGNLDRY
jgi:hypothetical protein